MEESMKPRKKRNRRRRHRVRHHVLRNSILFCVAACFAVVIYFNMSYVKQNQWYPNFEEDAARQENLLDTEFGRILGEFAKAHNLSLQEWPSELIELGIANPEAEEFVLNYPLKSDHHFTIDLDGLQEADEVPLLFQWDERWGYSEYSGTVMGISGCGPTCLSMVCIYLLNDPNYHPQYIAKFSEDHGYSVDGKGSSWTLISEGGAKLGLDVTEIPLDENRIIKNLKVNNPIICVMGPGDFTTTGHFVVMTGYENGKIKVNDPNSRERSEKLWEYDQIQDQIRNLWVCRL